jgi:hypothetical protein
VCRGIPLRARQRLRERLQIGGWGVLFVHCFHRQFGATGVRLGDAARVQLTIDPEGVIREIDGGDINDVVMDLSHLQAERDRDVAVLVAQATPEKSLELIERAETLAPDRPELVWLHRAICERAMCDMQPQIESKIRTLDPGNGFVWAWELQRGRESFSAPMVTEALVRMGESSKMTDYMNQLEVMI